LSCLMLWAHLPAACGMHSAELSGTFAPMISAGSPFWPLLVELLDAGAARDPERIAYAVQALRRAVGQDPVDGPNGFYAVVCLMATYAGRSISSGGGLDVIAPVEALLVRVAGDAPFTWSVQGPATMILSALIAGKGDEARTMFGRLLDNHGADLGSGLIPLLAGTLASFGSPSALVAVDAFGIPEAVVNPAAAGVPGTPDDPGLHAATLIQELVKAARSGASDWLELVAAELADVSDGVRVLVLWQMFTSIATHLAQTDAAPQPGS
jgi:hypothetical protein